MVDVRTGFENEVREGRRKTDQENERNVVEKCMILMIYDGMK